MKAKEFDKKFEEGQDISKYLEGLSKNKKELMLIFLYG